MYENPFHPSTPRRQTSLPHVDNYRVYLSHERGYSPCTVQAYVKNVRAWLRWLESHSYNYLQAGYDEIFEYVCYLVDSSYSRASVNQYIAAIKSYYVYLDIAKVTTLSSVMRFSSARVRRKLPDVLTLEEIDRLIAAVPTNYLEAVRDRAIFQLLFSSGIRVTECCMLRLSNIDLERGIFKVTGKGNKERYAFIDPTAAEALRAWFQYRMQLDLPTEEADFCFVSAINLSHLSRITIWSKVKYYAQLAGIKKNVHPHTFRHSFATALLQGGANVFDIKRLMGHADLRSTEFYLHTDTTAMRTAIENCHPRNILYRQRHAATV